MAQITLTITADGANDLRGAIFNLYGGYVHGDFLQTEADGADEASVGGEGAPAKRGRGRPKKEEAAPVAASVAAPDASVSQVSSAAPAVAAPEPAAPAVAPINAVGALTPTGARDAATAAMQARFASDPQAMNTLLPAIQSICAKYGVAEFKDIPDDKALAFHADIQMALAGTYVA